MTGALNNHLVRMRYALESVAEEDREAIVRLAEAAACFYGDKREERFALAMSEGEKPIIWKGS